MHLLFACLLYAMMMCSTLLCVSEAFRALFHRWATNLDTLSWLLVDRVYMGAFMEPPGALCVLEFLLAVLQLANMDQRVEDATPAAKSLLFTRATGRQVEAYVQALLKNTNRMLMFCFLPVANSNINSDRGTKDEFITPTQKNNDYLILSKESTFTDVTDQNLVEGDSVYTRGGVGGGGGLDKAVVLRLLLANQKLILCGSNVDPELMSTLCVNLFHMVWDNEQSIRTLAIDVWKVLLKLRIPALEEILISHGMQVHSFVRLSLYPNKSKWSKDSREYKKKLLCLSFTSFHSSCSYPAFANGLLCLQTDIACVVHVGWHFDGRFARWV